MLPDGTKKFELTAEVVPWEVSPGKTVQAWSYNGTVPGPTIRVNVGELQIGGTIHVKDLVLPEGVTAVTDADAIVVAVKAPEAEAGAVPGEAAETAEPEVIGRKAADEAAEAE